ncbi:hypothetical protein MAHJHV58_41670 [Mycobacterium avium subsp. hominissuis]|uniref:Uncharacterized protein n=1 Tax=Mycobacterium avium subsp. hominissuis TaxID=439334 RepID=A0AAI8SNR8_MYCAV|nr:hypothetical protein MAH_2353 [Mycobacterium avium subsp. hominissuis TH135]BBN48326.1 hypothetical protein JPH1_28010 [Mycobacterium avium subsp. hominissuis]
MHPNPVPVTVPDPPPHHRPTVRLRWRYSLPHGSADRILVSLLHRIVMGRGRLVLSNDDGPARGPAG